MTVSLTQQPLKLLHSEVLVKRTMKPERSSWKRIYDFVTRTFSSPLFWVLIETTALFAFSITAITLPAVIPLTVFVPVLAVGGIVMVLQVFLMRRPLAYECLLLGCLFKEAVEAPHSDWWNDITRQVTLGAIPLKNHGHIEALAKKGITAVLSLVELFEFEPKTLTVPARYRDWASMGIKHLHLPARDSEPLAHNTIAAAVDFIHQEVRRGGKVYVHCMSGDDRSAMAVASYLYRHNFRFDSMEAAILHLSAKRPGVHFNVRQRRRLQEFRDYHTRHRV